MSDHTTRPPAISASPDTTGNSLAGMVATAAAALARAKTAAEVFDVIQRTTVAYDAARTTARLAKARDAHAEIITACHRAQADALEIEAAAQCRLADEYDGAQERGEVQTAGGDRTSIVPNKNNALPTVDQIGLSRKLVHEARQVRNAERENPGVVRQKLDERLSKGEAPTRADVKRAIEPKPIVTAAPTTFAPRTATPAPVTDDGESDYDADLDDTDLGSHVYVGMYPDGEVRIRHNLSRVFLAPDEVLELLHWIEHDYLPRTRREPRR